MATLVGARHDAPCQANARGLASELILAIFTLPTNRCEGPDKLHDAATAASRNDATRFNSSRKCRPSNECENEPDHLDYRA